MRKLFMAAAMVIALSAFAGASTIEGRFGYFNPSGVSGNGNIFFGASYGKGIDQMVKVSVGLDYFGKTFDEKIEVGTDTAITQTTLTKVLYSHTVRYIPLFASVNITLPIGFAIKPYAGLDLSYSLGNVSYSYNDTLAASAITTGPDDGWYAGFGWRIRAGGRMALGVNSALIAQAFYNNNTISRDEEGGYQRELDMSGLGLCAALELSGF